MKKFLSKKRMAGGGKKVRIALDAMSKALTVYDVTYGEGSVWTQNDENKGLRFIANGYHAKLQDIVINGAVVDKKHRAMDKISTERSKP